MLKKTEHKDSETENVTPEEEVGVAPAQPRFHHIDHIAVAVHDLEAAIIQFRDVMGFRLQRRRHIKGSTTGMISAEMEMNGLRMVLCQGTEPASQVSQLITQKGAGVAHIALAVDDVDSTMDDLKSQGMEFDTGVIRGGGLTQTFSSRCENTGLTFEFIKRDGEQGFLEENVQELFNELEKAKKY